MKTRIYATPAVKGLNTLDKPLCSVFLGNFDEPLLVVRCWSSLGEPLYMHYWMTYMSLNAFWEDFDEPLYRAFVEDFDGLL